MTIDTLIILAGSLVVLLPFLGFPHSWDTFIFFALGVFIIGLGIAVRRRKTPPEAFRPPHVEDTRSE